MTSNQPTQEPQAQANARRERKGNTPELWATIATVLVLVPATSFTSDAARDAGVPHWVTAAVAAAIAVASFALLSQGTGKARDGVLFGLWIISTLTAVRETAQTLDVSEEWIIMVLLVPVLAALLLRYYRQGGERTF